MKTFREAWGKSREWKTGWRDGREILKPEVGEVYPLRNFGKSGSPEYFVGLYVGYDSTKRVHTFLKLNSLENSPNVFMVERFSSELLRLNHSEICEEDGELWDPFFVKSDGLVRRREKEYALGLLKKAGLMD